MFVLLLSLVLVNRAGHNHLNITKEVYDELKQAFLYFDRNNDGIVHISEHAVGIISASEKPEPV